MDGLTSFRRFLLKNPVAKSIKILIVKLLSTQKLVFIKKGMCCAKRICLLPCAHYAMHMQGSYESAELRVTVSKHQRGNLGV